MAASTLEASNGAAPCAWYHEDLRSEYSIVKELGSGQFGTTYLVVNRASGAKYACKSINKHTKNFNRSDVQREVQILAALSSNPYVVDLAEVWEDSHHVHVIMELCEGGDISVSVMHQWLQQPCLKSSKHAMMHKYYIEPGQRLRQLAGSSFYIAPEVLKGNYGFEADLWSAGVIIYILLSGLPPFWGSSEKQIFRRILYEPLDLTTNPWPEVSDKAKDIVSRLLDRNMSTRMTIDQALEHPWITEFQQLPDRPLSGVVFNRLKRFTEMTKLHGIMLNVVAKYLPDESIGQLREMFKTLDKGNKGTINADDLKEAVKQLGVSSTPEVVEGMLQRLDADNSGEIEYEEFLAAAVNKKELVTDHTLNHIFAQLDRDGDGVVSIDELHEILDDCNIEITRDQLQELLQTEGGLSNGELVTPEVFRKLMLDLARDDLIPGRLEAFMDSAMQYTKNNMFKQLALMVIASTIPPEDLQELNELFTSIDEEGSGTITYEQLRRSLEMAGCQLAKEEVDDLLKGMDVTGNGLISYPEFIAGCLEKQNLVTEMKIREAFDFFDADGNGSISVEELEVALEQLEMDSREARKLMALADADNSESITFEEFRDLLLNTDKPNLINRMASIASVATAASPNFLARSSMTPGLARASMDPNLLRQSVAPNLFRSSMAAPSLARASMGLGGGANPLENKLIEVEMEWRKGSFTGLSRPSMSTRSSLNRPSMISDLSMTSRVGSNSSQRSTDGSIRGPMLSRPSMDKKHIGYRSGPSDLPPTMEE